jgi:hypothetical protein
MAEPAKLWKNKPHPMRLFSARSQFFQRDLDHRRLGFDKTFQIEIVVGHAVSPGMWSVSVLRIR